MTAHWTDIFGDYDDGRPLEAGWYATLHTWDMNEGIFPGALWWDGREWGEFFADRGWRGLNDAAPIKFHPTNAVVWWFPWQFAAKEDAEAFAEKNDPER